MDASLFHYELPEELIAQEPVEPRDHSRLMVLNRATQTIEHRRFYELPEYLQAGDVLVLNDTRVSAWRLRGRKPTGGQAEVFLLHPLADGRWHALVKPGRRLPDGSRVIVGDALEVVIEGRLEGGLRLVRLLSDEPPEQVLPRIGQVPLPPYIHKQLTDPERYQTVYAHQPGSAAAPTAGLHFTPALLERLKTQGVQIVYITLHVSLDTFRPLKTEQVEQHKMHGEWYT
ncbi:MAG: S-adenosylmethionine:tRNA ribosyltransferase-isomerase, partial [Fimbriimonadales bacterium]|nr:S-adenosylmethionine:tRNA ribosyltransferase-isomerase [Fimbriimonadales bacterium]